MLLFLVVGPSALAQSFPWVCENPKLCHKCYPDDTCIIKEVGKGTNKLWLKNNGSSPRTYAFFLMNPVDVRVSRKVPDYIFLYPQETKPLLAVTSAVYRGGFSYGMNNFYTVGKPGVKHDDSYVYRLPYQNGRSFSCKEGFRNKANPDWNNIIFDMPNGTPVVAARPGVVVGAVNVTPKLDLAGEYKQYGSAIYIEHEDGTMGRYAYLKKDSFLVKLGDQVKRGQQIALSGSSGEAKYPSLRFDVLSTVDAYMYNSWKFKFQDSTRGVVDQPVEGAYYTAVD